jgi:hypothetical protein
VSVVSSPSDRPAVSAAGGWEGRRAGVREGGSEGVREGGWGGKEGGNVQSSAVLVLRHLKLCYESDAAGSDASVAATHGVLCVCVRVCVCACQLACVRACVSVCNAYMCCGM